MRGKRRDGTQAPLTKTWGSNSRHRLSREVQFVTLNVGAMTGKRVGVVELMTRKQLLVMGVQVTKWKGDRAVDLCERFNMLHSGGDGKIY